MQLCAILYQMLASRSKRSSRARRRGRLPLLAGNNRRTTLTLPESACQRERTLRSIVADVIADSLRNGKEGARRVAWMRRLRRMAYVPRNEEERLLLEGIVLDETLPE